MTQPSKPPRLILLRASRETVVLLATATAMTFAIASAVHRRPSQDPVARATPVQQGWAGQLAGIAPDTAAPVPVEPLTSASLVVEPPPPVVAPPAPVVPATSAIASVTPSRAPGKGRGCDQPTCPTVTAQAVKAGGVQIASASPVKPAAAPEIFAPAREKDGTGLISRLNPLRHLPDSVRHPFDTAGNAVSGWIKRL